MNSNIFSKSKTSFRILLLVLLAVSGIVLIIFISLQWGIGLTPDSVFYIAAGQNILNGNGVTVLYNEDGTAPLNLWIPSNSKAEILVMRWPPLYPGFLALAGLAGLDLLSGARLLSALFFGVNIFLISVIVNKYTQSLWLSMISGIIVFSSEVMLLIHSNAISEPLFIMLGFSGLYLLSRYLKNNKILYILLSAVLISLAFLTRYAGLTLIITGILAILFLSNENGKKRIVSSVIFTGISCFPTVIWLARLNMIAGGVTDRVISFHLITMTDIKGIISTFSKWLIIKELPFIASITLVGFFIVILISGFIIFSKKSRNNNYLKDNWILKIIVLYSLFIIVYILFLFISKSFFDAQIPIASFRILSPVYIAFLVVTLIFLEKLFFYLRNNQIFKIFIVVIVIILISSYLYHGVNWSLSKYRDGQGYAQPYFISSEVIQKLRGVSNSKIMYSNAPDIIYLFTNRSSNWLPAKFNANNFKLNEDYEFKIGKMIDEIKDNKGVIVIFSGKTRNYLLTIDELQSRISLSLLAVCSDGEIYEIINE